MVARRQIRQFVSKLVVEFSPERVILFGSVAKGDASGDSDVDLLVIMETGKKPVQQALDIRHRVPCPFALDLLVRTPHEMDRRVELGDAFLMTILAEGETLYESPRH